MHLKLEVDGFKNLIDFAVSFGPFTCIGGENGVGKSNVFDAIQFLSLIADGSLLNAAQEVRSSREDSAGEPDQLFTAGIPSRRMRFGVEWWSLVWSRMTSAPKFPQRSRCCGMSLNWGINHQIVARGRGVWWSCERSFITSTVATLICT